MPSDSRSRSARQSHSVKFRCSYKLIAVVNIPALHRPFVESSAIFHATQGLVDDDTMQYPSFCCSDPTNLFYQL